MIGSGDGVADRGGTSAGTKLGARAAAVLFLALITFQAVAVATAPLEYDDAYLSGPAKSLALGHGYATHYPEVRPFDHELGVGPALQLPAAACIAVFGARFWVPGLSVVVLIAALLLALAFQLELLLGRELGRSRFAVAILAFLVLLADDNWMITHWHRFLGDVPASLLAVLGVLLTVRAAARGEVAGGAAGLAFGLALQMKLYVVFGLAPAALWTLHLGWRERHRRGTARALAFLGGALLPSVLVQLAQLAAIRELAGSWALLRSRLEWLAWISGASGAVEDVGFARLGPNAQALSDYLGGATGAIGFVALVASLATLCWRRSAQVPAIPGEAGTQAQTTARLLLAAFGLHLTWWLLLSEMGWINHLTPAFFYLGTALALAPAALRRDARSFALVAAAVLLTAPRTAWIGGYLRPHEQRAAVAAALEARDFLLESSPAGAVRLGCSWWVARDLDFLLPGVGNFRDCLRVDPGLFATDTVLLVRWKPFWNWEHDPRLDEFAATCEQRVLFRNDRYVVSRCTRAP